jgi:hypothetical protein
MLSHITVGQLALKLKALDEIHLPKYKGSTLRGGFGYALKEVSCTRKRQDCGTCMLRERCVYLYLFETPPPPDAEIMRLYPTAPHPFIIEPPENGDRVIPQREDFEFGLTVIGRALDYIPYFIYAFIRLGETGLGKGKNKFSLENVSAMSPDGFIPIYNKENQSLKKPDPFPDLPTVDARCESMRSARRLGIEFKTPTRIKSGGHLNDGPEFHHLIRSLLRRLSALSYFHCGRKLDADFKGLIERASQIECVSSDVHWRDWDRYSTRQKQKMTLGGFVGETVFSGDFREFLPLLVWGETLHVGKAASFGLGKYILKRA